MNRTVEPAAMSVVVEYRPVELPGATQAAPIGP
jgi:hypothetical protein